MKNVILKQLSIVIILPIFLFCPKAKADVNELIVYAKGTEAQGEYAHFFVKVDGIEIGNAFTTSFYQPYTFTLDMEASLINEVHLVFDNDFYSSDEDRNLYIHSISIGEEIFIEVSKQSVKYISANGDQIDLRTWMGWNGELVFDLKSQSINPERDIFLSSQAEVDAFRSNYIGGNLTISGKDITSLSNLSIPKHIWGSLIIKDNPVLTSLAGLETIESIGGYLLNGSLIIQNNPLITNLDGLGSLYGGNIIIKGNKSLKNLNGLSSLGNVEFFNVSDNPSLEVIEGFNSIKFCFSIHIVRNNSLKSIDGFNLLPKMECDLFIEKNPNLEVFNGLTALTYCPIINISQNKTLNQIPRFNSLTTCNDFLIFANNSLKRIISQAPLAEMQNITIQENQSLESISAFYHLKSVKSFLKIINNSSLPDLNEGFRSLKKVDVLSIEGNKNLNSLCTLYPLFYEGKVKEASIIKNGIDFTADEIVANGPCVIPYNIVISAKGTSVNGEFSHFKLFVNGKEYGDNYTTSEFQDFTYQMSFSRANILEIRIAFDNDLIFGKEDRNLFIQGVEIGDNLSIEITPENFTYISDDGNELEYNDMMKLNGELIFNLNICQGDLTLSSQSDVNVFNCQYVNGNLTISGDDIVDLSPLSSLNRINGALLIQNNPNLRELNGLNNLSNCGPIFIEKNPEMENIDAINSSNFYSLDVIDNNTLTEIHGFNSLSGSIFGISIYRNPTLEVIDGFNSIQECEHIYIHSNESLKILRGLKSLLSFYSDDEGGLSIDNNPKLEIIDAFESLEWCYNTISIRYNLSLKKIEGFNSLKWVRRGLGIGGNSSLHSIDGFNSLGACGGLGISSNELLKSISGFNSFSGMEYDENFVITNNPLLEEINAFASFTTGGTIAISNNSSLGNLDFLSTISFLYSTLEISRNSSLMNIDGLKSLEEASKIEVIDNSSLVDLDGFKSLKALRVMDVENNSNLISFCGLYPLLNDGDVGSLNFVNNGIEITKEEILANGPCDEENEIIVSVKGTEADHVFAHFKVLVDGQELGNSYTTSEYTSYNFPLFNDPSEIDEVRIRFDNDLYTVDEDRNLFVKSITISNDSQIEATPGNVTYISVNGHPQQYNGMMGWNGDLIFDLDNFIDCDSDVTLTSQAQVNRFSCQYINGSLTIIGEDITDLSPLSILRGVKDDLIIINNNSLETISGFNSLAEVSRLIVNLNPNLKTIEGFNSLERCNFIYIGQNMLSEELQDAFSSTGQPIIKPGPYELWIHSNSKLNSVKGFNSVADLGIHWNFSNNPELEVIDGFNKIRSLYTIRIDNNASLKYFKGFNSFLTVYEGGLSICNNSKIENIEAFSSLGGAGLIAICKNGSLKNLNFLSSLSSVEDFLISENNALENIDGLSSLKFTNGSLTIDNNPLLKEINGLIGLRSITDSYGDASNGLYILNNSSLTNIDGLRHIQNVQYSINIENNSALVRFCGLYPIIDQGSVNEVNISGNRIEITAEEILSNGPCEQENGIIVRAKGTRGNGEYARFKVYTDNTLLGETYTTAEFTPYTFAIPYDAGRINKARVIFNNDYSNSTEDRNLIIDYIMINGRRFDAAPDEVTYIRDMDRQEIYYDYIMPWNGQLIFDINYALASNARITVSSNLESNTDRLIKSEFEIYPNPATDHININVRGYERGTYQFEMFDLSGKLQLLKYIHVKDNHENINFDITSLHKGVYISHFSINNTTEIRKKVVIQ